jgi:uncharacterized protein YbdZ (MbtH family)
MDTPENPSCSPDPFPEPQTIPGGWDASVLDAASQKKTVKPTESRMPESFGAPRTIPAGWDISAME